VERSRTFLRDLARRFTFNDFLLGVLSCYILCGVERTLFKKESGTGRPNGRGLSLDFHVLPARRKQELEQTLMLLA